MNERDKEKYPDSSKKKPSKFDDGDEVWVGKLQVLKSPAGWYIGRYCWVKDKHGEYEDALSRETDYYGTEEAAAAELKNMTFDVRDCSENNFAYSEGHLPMPETKPK